MQSSRKNIDLLKTIAIFSETSDEVLATVLPLLEELHTPEGARIIEKGEAGESMFIIAEGRVRVHDGDRTLDYLHSGEVFGEMSALFPEPRSASVTTIDETYLLRLDRKPLYELIGTQAEVSLGIIQMLSERLHNRVMDLDRFHDHLEQVMLPMAISLSTEKDLDQLLEQILLETKRFCRADAATLYLRTPEDQLIFEIVHTDSLGIAMGGTTGIEVPYPPLELYDPETGQPNTKHVATYATLHNKLINIPDIYRSKEFDFSATRAFDQSQGYRSSSSLTIPLNNHLGEVIGVFQLFNARDPKTDEVVPFDTYQQRVGSSLASMAALNLNTQMLLTRQEELLKFELDLQIGRQIQADFLPKKLPQIPGWEIRSSFIPASEVAGDFYDAFYISKDKVGLMIGDVVDKGVGAALFMALSRSLLRAFAEQVQSFLADPNNGNNQTLGEVKQAVTGGLTPEAAILNVVKITNDYIADHHADLNMFATLFFGVLDPKTGQLTYINAGHNAPLVIHPAEGIKTRLEPTGPAMGLFSDMGFDILHETLGPEDVLVTYTDGVTDARNEERTFFSAERLISLLAEPAETVDGLIGRVEEALNEHIGEAQQYDDITMLAIRRL